MHCFFVLLFEQITHSKFFVFDPLFRVFSFLLSKTHLNGSNNDTRRASAVYISGLTLKPMHCN